MSKGSFVVDDVGGFVGKLKPGDLVNISTKNEKYKVVAIKWAGDEPRFGPLWLLTLEENVNGNNFHHDYVKPDGTSIYYHRMLSPTK